MDIHLRKIIFSFMIKYKKNAAVSVSLSERRVFEFLVKSWFSAWVCGVFGTVSELHGKFLMIARKTNDLFHLFIRQGVWILNSLAQSENPKKPTEAWFKL